MTMDPEPTLADNLIRVRERIARAAERAGRDPGEIRLVAVTKTQSAARIREAVAAGATDLGENYVQEAEEKFVELGPVQAVRHMIGHLQKNKAGKAAALFDVVQSIDSVELAAALGRRATALGRALDVLIEVNISGDENKNGTAPAAALDLASSVADIEGVRLRGFMGIGPLHGDEAGTRKSFQALRRLYDQLPVEHRQILSMGMTADFELAIAEGSTMVRVGAGIFGARRS